MKTGIFDCGEVSIFRIAIKLHQKGFWSFNLNLWNRSQLPLLWQLDKCINSDHIEFDNSQLYICSSEGFAITYCSSSEVDRAVSGRNCPETNRDR